MKLKLSFWGNWENQEPSIQMDQEKIKHQWPISETREATIATYSTDIKRRKNNYKQVYDNKFDNVNEMDNFL